MKKKFKLISIDNVAIFLLVLFIIYFSYLSLARHAALMTSQNDLGTYSQLTWNTLHGRFFEASGAMLAVTLTEDNKINEHFNYLSAHFSPILLFFVPWYAIWSDPRIFLIIQAIAVGLAALPIYWLTKEKLKSKLAGLLIIISYLFYPIIHNALLYDFHEVTFAVPLVTFALWYCYRKKFLLMSVFLFLLMLVQEHTSLIVFMFGIYLALFNKKKKLGLIIAGIALGYFLLVIFYLMPHFSTTGSLVLLKSEASAVQRYAWLGSNFPEIFNNFVNKPGWVISNMFGFKQLEYLIILLLPLLYLSIFSEIILLSLPILAISFLSQLSMTYSEYFYHSVIVVGIIYISAIYALSRIFKNYITQKILLIVMIVVTLIFSYFYSLTPFSKRYYWSDYQPSKNSKLLKEVKKIIPADATIVVQNNLGPHFSNRQYLFPFPFMLERADYVILDIADPFSKNKSSIFKFNTALMGEQNFNLKYFSWWFGNVIKMFSQSDFGVIYFKDGWLVFQKGANHNLNRQALLEFNKKFKEILDFYNLKLD